MLVGLNLNGGGRLDRLVLFGIRFRMVMIGGTVLPFVDRGCG